MKIHPELRERFDEAMRFYMHHSRSKTPAEVYQQIKLQVFKEQQSLLGPGQLEGQIKEKRNCNGGCYMFCSCRTTQAFEVKRKLRTSKPGDIVDHPLLAPWDWFGKSIFKDIEEDDSNV